MRKSLTSLGLVAAAALLSAALAAPAGAAPQGVISNAGGATAVADSYIVVLNDTDSLRAEGAPGVAQTLAQRYHGQLLHVYQHALNGFSTTMSEAAARSLAADPAVASVEQNHTVSVDGVQPNPPSWGLDRTDQHQLPLDNAYRFPGTAANVHAYIIDTGIRVTHETFGGRATSGVDVIDNDDNADDCYGHGTHVAGTVGGREYGIAKSVKLVAVRVLDCSGHGTDEQVIAGIDWVTGNAIKPAVANMSLGGSASPSLDTAVENSIAAGITYGIAAGNGNIIGSPRDACNYSPARVPEALTVGATDITDHRASFSNYGTCLDLFGPGVGITSAWNTSDTATSTISGTSMATPHVVGVAALYLSYRPTASPAQVRDFMVGVATPGVVIDPKEGSPNLLLYAGRG